MSFGWGAGDVVRAIKLSKDIYDALTGSTTEYKTFAIWLRSLSTTLELFQRYETTEDQRLNPLIGSCYTSDELSELHDIVQPLKTSVDRFLTTLERYLLLREKPEKTNGLDWFKKQGKKLQWSFLEKEDVHNQKNEVSQHLVMLHTVVLARASRDRTTAVLSLSDRADANHRSLMRVASDTNKTVTMLSNVVYNFILASGEVPDMPPISADMSTNSIGDAESVLHFLEQQVPTASWRPSCEADASIKVGYYTRDVLERWLEPQTQQACLWILDEHAVHVSQPLVAARREERLPVVYYQCDRFEADGKILEPEQILRRLSYSFLHQLLCYIVDRQLPMPVKLDVGTYRGLDQDPNSSMSIIRLVSSLIQDSSRLVWVIDNFDRLEDEDIPVSEVQRSALDTFMTLIGARKEPGVSKTTAPIRKCLITTTSRSSSLIDSSLKEDLAIFVPAERADPKRYTLIDELKGMMLWEKENSFAAT